MIIFISLLLSRLCPTLCNNWGSDIVFVTAEGGFDIAPLYTSISSLELLSDKIESSNFFEKSQNPSHQRLVKWLIQRIRLTLAHTKETIRDLGFQMDHRPSGSPNKAKRAAPFSFVGQLESSLFGTVTEEEFNRFKSMIQKSFTIYHSDSSLVRGLISDNRRALIETLKVVQSNADNFERQFDIVIDDMRLISRLFQASLSLNAIERFIITLSSVKASCDRNFISRHIMSPSMLSSYLLKLSDQISGHSPVYNTESINVYYKLRLSVSTISDSVIKQLITIPIISVNDQFTVSHAQCQVSHICLENSHGTMTVPTTDFLRCHGATLGGVPTICRNRQCLTGHHSVCRAFNLTSFLISTKQPFEAVINCESYDKTVLISNVTYLNVPIHCSVTSKALKIPVVHTMFSHQVNHVLIYIPFQLTDQTLYFNLSGLDPALRRQLALKGVRDLIRTRVPPAPTPIPALQVPVHKSLSIGSISLSSFGILIIIVIITLVVVCRKRIAKFFQ